MWREHLPYADICVQEGTLVGVSPVFLMSTIAQETGGLFHPYAQAYPERSFGLGQALEKYHGRRPQGRPWWEPEAAITHAARELATWARRLEVSGRPKNWDEWIALRMAYNGGLAFARRRGTPTKRANAIRWAEAVSRRSVTDPLWGRRWASVNVSDVEDHVDGQQVATSVGGVTVRWTRWATEHLPRARFRVGLHEMDEETLVAALLDGPIEGVDQPGAFTRKEWRAPRSRLAVALIKVGRLLAKYQRGGAWTIASLARSAESDRRRNPGVRVSQHALFTAADLVAPEGVRAIAAGRLLVGWAVGPELLEIGGIGVYARSPRSLHVDARARVRGRISRWAWGYPLLNI